MRPGSPGGHLAPPDPTNYCPARRCSAFTGPLPTARRRGASLRDVQGAPHSHILALLLREGISWLPLAGTVRAPPAGQSPSVVVPRSPGQ